MLNHLVIMGRVTRDPELRRTPTGVAVATFSIACDRDYKAAGADKPATDFIRCVAWRSTAEYAAKWFPKGRMAIVAGRLEISSYTDRDGTRHTSSEINVENIYYGDYSKPAALQDGSAGAGNAGGEMSADDYLAQLNWSDQSMTGLDDDDTLPF